MVLKRLFIALDIVFLLWTACLVYFVLFNGGSTFVWDSGDFFGIAILTLPYLLVRFVIAGSALPFTKTK